VNYYITRNVAVLCCAVVVVESWGALEWIEWSPLLLSNRVLGVIIVAPRTRFETDKMMHLLKRAVATCVAPICPHIEVDDNNQQTAVTLPS
jgi:hypothetical protein